MKEWWNNLMSWNNLRVLGNFHLLKVSYVALFVMPVILSVITRINKNLESAATRIENRIASVETQCPTIEPIVNTLTKQIETFSFGLVHYDDIPAKLRDSNFCGTKVSSALEIAERIRALKIKPIKQLVGFLSALLLSVALVIFSVACPDMVKRNETAEDYLVAMRTAYSERALASAYGVDFEKNLLERYDEKNQEHRRSRWIARLFFVLGAIGVVTIVAWHFVYWLMTIDSII